MSAIIPPRGGETAFLGLGSNVGDRFAHLQAAVDRLHATDGIRVEEVSSVYETDPVGGPEQEPYYNVVVRVATALSPRRLLKACAVVEQTGGRIRHERWGPRTIDIDILLYGPRTVQTKSLQIPHPRLVQRAFALIPLAEVAPGWALPDGTRLTAAIGRLAPITGIGAIGTQVTVPEPVP